MRPRSKSHLIKDFRLAALNFIEQALIMLSLSILAAVYLVDVTDALVSAHMPHSIMALHKFVGRWLFALIVTPGLVLATSLPVGISVGVLLSRHALRYAIFVAALATFSLWGMTFGDPQSIVIALVVAAALVLLAHWASSWRVSGWVESLWHRPRPSIPRFFVLLASDGLLCFNLLTSAAVWRNVFLGTGRSAEYEAYALRFGVLVLLLSVLIRYMVRMRNSVSCNSPVTDESGKFIVDSSAAG